MRTEYRMSEIVFSGPEGRLEGRYHSQSAFDAPIALILHPHPAYGGTMNNKVVYKLYYSFYRLGFAVMRFNFRGVGRSQGESEALEDGIGELSDAAASLDFLQSKNPNSKQCWVAGFSYGAWIGMQLLMRRPEINGFVSVAPPVNSLDFTFLAPCPSSGIIINGTKDTVTPPEDILTLVKRLQNQKGIDITHRTIKGADHFFEGPVMDELVAEVNAYVMDRCAAPDETPRNQPGPP